MMQYVETAGLLAEGLRRVIGVTFFGVVFARLFTRCAQGFSNKDSSMYVLTCAVFYACQAFKLLALIVLKVLYKDPLLLLNPRVWAKACRFSGRTAALVAHTQLQCMKWSAGNLKQLVYKASGHMTADDYLERDFPIGVTPPWAQEDRDRHRHLLKGYNAKFSLLRALPLRTVSRCWGIVARLELPVWLRATTHGLYVRVFDCRPQECTDPDLTHYPTISSFFRRSIRPELRPISYRHDLTSPADGTVLYLQEVQDGVLEQIKDVTYSLQGFLGPPQEGQSSSDEGRTLSDREYHRSLLSQEGHQLYQVIVYLGPGDYHHFHSPADWAVRARRHFPGELFSVNPSFARWVQGMFNMNERAIYTGRWRYGFFSLTAVGATNVGSINVRFDPTLVTNVEEEFGGGVFYDAQFEGRKNRGVKVRKGHDIGDFSMGSTIVLLFEAPKSFRFSVKPGDKIKVGQGIGTCKRASGKWK